MDSVLEVAVVPGAQLALNLIIEAYNLLPPTSIAPLVMVWTWGDHASSFRTLDSWIPQGLSSHQITDTLIAPSVPGTYYITFAHSGETAGQYVASLTNWPWGEAHWNDGVDIADWNPAQYDQSLIHHAVSTQYESLHGFYCRWVGAAMIKITVLDCYDFPPQAPQIVIRSEGNNACISWPRVTESLLGCPVNVDAYLVWYSPSAEGPYYFHGYTTDTAYVHYGVVTFEDGMFYQVDSYIGALGRLHALPQGASWAIVSSWLRD